MLTALYTGVSGMNANSTALSVISNDIANLNTVGYKESTVNFGDILSQTIAGGTSQVGRGVEVTDVSPSFTQGSTKTTTNVLDLTVDGDGFFVFSDGTSYYYSRDGQCKLDSTGNIVDSSGKILQGYLTDSSGNISGTIGDLNVANAQASANATASVDIAANLDATSSTTTWAFTSPSANPPDTTTYNNSTTITMYDSQGGAHDVTVYFCKTADNAWTAHYVFTDSTGQYVEAGSQNLSFGTDGSLTNDNEAALTFAWGGGVANGAVTFNYGTGTGETPAGTGLDMTTQFGSSYSVLSVSQDGYSAGSLESLSIASDGTITGSFTNGQTRILGQIVLANFIAPTELTQVGDNLYTASYSSGQPVIGSPDTSGLGSILAYSLEESNVDLANEFVEMIAAQRGFQANSKIITTMDEVLSELVNLKR